MRTTAVLLAAGKGLRVNSSIPKQFLDICGKELWEYSFETVHRVHTIDRIVIVTLREWVKHIRQRLTNVPKDKVVEVIEGGEKRQDSVYNALVFISEDRPDIVAIHDTARPMASQQHFVNCINAAMEYGACTLASEVIDTMIRAKNEHIIKVVPRAGLYHVQTPQCFKFDIIYKAHNNAKAKDTFYTDDATLVLNELAIDVKIILGERTNIKITSRSDIELLRCLIAKKGK